MLVLSSIFPSGVRLANLIPVPPISIVAMVIVFTIKRGESAVSPYFFAPPFFLCLLFEIKFLLF